MTDAQTIRTYAEKAADYAQLTDASLQKDPQLATFTAALPAGGRVLDLGCGPGAAAHLMAQQGLHVTAMDAVAEMLALVPDHALITRLHADFDHIPTDALFDGIWANFSLLHAPRADMPRHLTTLRQTLGGGGVFHIGLKLGTGSKRDAIGRLYTYYTEDELTGLLTTAGFKPVATARGRDKGLDGVPADWITIRADA